MRNLTRIGLGLVLALAIAGVVFAASDSATQIIEAQIIPCSEFKMIDTNVIYVELEPGDVQTGSVTLRIWSNTVWQLSVSAEPLSTEGKDPQAIPQENFTHTSSFEAPGKNVKVVDAPTQFSVSPTFVAEGLDSTTDDEGIEVTILYTINCPLDQEPGQYQTVLNFALVNKI